MKTSLTKLKNNSAVLFFLGSIFFNSALAGPVAQVVEVSGQVFVINEMGKTKSLIKDDHLEEKSEVLVEEGASITLNDYYDSTYHLIGGSHVKLFDKSIQLKKGKTWVQSKNDKHQLGLTSANGLIEFRKSEFIATFDQAHSKTQVLVVNGEIDFSNVLDQNHRQTVSSGTFTFIDPKIEDGLPRPATKVGLQSLNLALAEFKGLPEEIKKVSPLELNTPKREIASVTEQSKNEKQTKRGEIIFIKTTRAPASVATGDAHGYFAKISKKKMKRSVSKKVELVPVRFFGLSANQNITKSIEGKKATKIRVPASVVPVSPNINPSTPNLEKINEPIFTESLKKHQKEQPKYSKELESLIHDLKSF